MKGITWQRDSHSLFDYESRNVVKRNIRITLDGQIMRNLNDIEYVAEGSKVIEKLTQDQSLVILKKI